MIKRMAYLAQWRPGAYLRASGELFLWLVLRSISQVIIVVLVARVLGAEDYGLFVTIIALASLFPPLVVLGMHGVILREGAKTPDELTGLLHSCMALWYRALVFVLPIAALAAWIFLPQTNQSLWLVLAVIATEIISASLLELLGRAEQSQHRMRYYGMINSGLVVIRLTVLGIYLILVSAPTVQGWLFSYSAANIVFVMGLYVWIAIRYPRPSHPTVPKFSYLLREGAPYLTGAVSFRLQGEFNKPVLAQLGYAQASYFGLAQRVIDLANLPLVALQETLWPRIYASDKSGRRLFITGILLVFLAMVGGAVLIVVSRWMPMILGKGFEPVSQVLVWLSGVPAAQVVRALLDANLIVQGRASQLTSVYIVTTVGSVMFVIFFVTYNGLLGAVFATYASIALQIILHAVLQVKYFRCAERQS